MSPCCGSVCLLVLLGVVVAYGTPVQYVSKNLSQTHKSIADVLGLSQPEIGSKNLFISLIRNISSSCQRKEEVLVMNAIMDVYMRIFTNILQHNHNQHHEKGNTPALLDKLSNTKRAEVVSALEKLKQEMEKLRHLSHLGHDKDDVFSVLKKIKEDDTTNQMKALAEFIEIYQMASVIGSRSCRPAHAS